jgi:hypothetical protein
VAWEVDGVVRRNEALRILVVRLDVGQLADFGLVADLAESLIVERVPDEDDHGNEGDEDRLGVSAGRMPQE